MNIREARLEDLPALVTFNQAMALETEGKELDEAVLSAGVGAVLKDRSLGFYLVAE